MGCWEPAAWVDLGLQSLPGFMRTHLAAGPVATVCQALRKHQGQRTWALLGFPRVRLSSAAHQHVTSTGHSTPLQMSLSLLPGAGEDTGRAVLSPALTGHRVGAHRSAGHPSVLVPSAPSLPSAAPAGPPWGQKQCMASVPEQEPRLLLREDH